MIEIFSRGRDSLFMVSVCFFKIKILVTFSKDKALAFYFCGKNLKNYIFISHPFLSFGEAFFADHL